MPLKGVKFWPLKIFFCGCCVNCVDVGGDGTWDVGVGVLDEVDEGDCKDDGRLGCKGTCGIFNSSSSGCVDPGIDNGGGLFLDREGGDACDIGEGGDGGKSGKGTGEEDWINAGKKSTSGSASVRTTQGAGLVLVIWK